MQENDLEGSRSRQDYRERTQRVIGHHNDSLPMTLDPLV